MGEEEEEEPKKKRVVVESLGWLTESTIMPKKHRAIAGVGASSIMELKAQLLLELRTNSQELKVFRRLKQLIELQRQRLYTSLLQRRTKQIKHHVHNT